MSKVLIASDLHLHPHRGSTARLEDGLQCLTWIYDVAREKSIKNLIFLGDFFHHRFSLGTIYISKGFNICQNAKKDGIHSYFLLGNHDLYDECSWENHSLKGVKEWGTVIDEPTKIIIDGAEVDFLPYTPTPTAFINKHPFDRPAKVLFSHLSILDAILNTTYDILSVEDDTKEKEVIKPEILHKWNKVWLGHYHYGQKVTNQVEYVGSPMQLTFGEAGQKKHVAIYDLHTGATEYVDNNQSQLFHIIDDLNDIDNLNLKDSYVKFTCPVTNKFEIRKKVYHSGARECLFERKIKSKNTITNQTFSDISLVFKEKNGLIDSYIESLANLKLDKETLKKIGKEIIHANCTKNG